MHFLYSGFMLISSVIWTRKCLHFENWTMATRGSVSEQVDQNFSMLAGYCTSIHCLKGRNLWVQVTGLINLRSWAQQKERTLLAVENRDAQSNYQKITIITSSSLINFTPLSVHSIVRVSSGPVIPVHGPVAPTGCFHNFPPCQFLLPAPLQ